MRTAESRREWAATLGVGAAVALFCVLLSVLSPAYFWHDDCQGGVVPSMIDLKRSLMAGEWPLLAPSNWNFGTYLGEYQSGIFSPIVLPMMVVAATFGGTMVGMATIFATFMLALTAMGAFRVARDEGLAPEYASLVALVAALNGWSMTWAASNWMPAATGFALLTWAWWALARLTREGGGTLGATLLGGVAIYLLMSGGWPLTIFMTAGITAWLLLRAFAERRTVWPVVPVVAAWLLGIGMAAPAWLPFVEYIGTTNRSTAGATLNWEWLVPGSGLAGLALPTWVSIWDTYGEPKPHVALELANGLVVTGALLAMLAGLGRRLSAPAAWALGLSACGLLLAMLPGMGMFRWSFRWLPLFHTGAALAAAHWLAARAAAGGRPGPAWAKDAELARWAGNPGVWAALAVGAALAGRHTVPGLAATLPIAYLVAAVAWAAIEDARPARDPLRRWAPAGLTLAVLFATHVQVPSGLAVPFWRFTEEIREVAPLDPDRRYFGVTSVRDYFADGLHLDAWGTVLRPGNTAMIAGPEFVNGYSALNHKGLAYAFEFALHGFLYGQSHSRVAAFCTARGSLLTRMGVDGLVLGASLRSLQPFVEKQGWKVVVDRREGVVLHRVGPPSPRAWSPTAVRVTPLDPVGDWRWALDQADGVPALAATPERPAGTLKFAARKVTIAAERRNAVTLDVGAGSAPAMVAVARLWLPGYKATTADGRSLGVVALDGVTLGVEVPADVAGRIELRYLPDSLLRGLAIAALTALGMLAALLVSLRRRRPA